VVRRARWPETFLREGDQVEIVHFVGGGSHNDVSAVLGRLKSPRF